MNSYVMKLPIASDDLPKFVVESSGDYPAGQHLDDEGDGSGGYPTLPGEDQKSFHTPAARVIMKILHEPGWPVRIFRERLAS